MYSEQVLDHFRNPHGVGDLDDASVAVEVTNPACGDVLRLSIRVEDGKIAEARFRAKGCVPSIACGSKLVELLRGARVEDAKSFQRELLNEKLGGLPEASEHASQLAIDALRAALSRVKGITGR